MTMITKLLAGGAGIAALAAAGPAAAQYPPYGYGYGYGQPQGYAHGYGYNPHYQATQMATQQCAAAVQARLNNQRSMTGILGAMLGAPMATGRVLGFTQVTPNRSTVRVRGVATSGRGYGYGPYGVGAYGAMGYAHQPDLSFKCDVDYRGRIRDVDINRRR